MRGGCCRSRHWPTLVLLQCFYGGALSFSGRSTFVVGDYFGGSYFLSFRLFSRYRCLSQTTVGGAYRLV